MPDFRSRAFKGSFFKGVVCLKNPTQNEIILLASLKKASFFKGNLSLKEISL